MQTPTPCTLMQHMEIKMPRVMIDNNTVTDELFKVWAQPVTSEFELQIKKEIDAWIKTQPMKHETYTAATKAFWSEKLK